MADFGTVPIDSKDIVVPTSEAIHKFTVELTRAGERCQIIADTTQRSNAANVGTVEAADIAVWDALDAMIATAQGQTFLTLLKGRVAAKPVKLNLSVTLA